MVSGDERAELVLELTVQPSTPIGYALVFRCRVERVVQGRCSMAAFDLTILMPDHSIALMLATKGPEDVLEAGFRKHRRNEPYPVMPITGFVDDQRTSWTLVYIR